MEKIIKMMSLLTLFLLAFSAHATHFRFGTISWVPDKDEVGNVIPYSVKLTLTNSWRRSAYTTDSRWCIDLTKMPLESKACSGENGLVGVGDIIVEELGQSVFNWGYIDDMGNVSPNVSSPLNSLIYLVTSINVTNDWIIATAIDPDTVFPLAADPETGKPINIDTHLHHTYDGPGSYTAQASGCCRVSDTDVLNQHINNPDKDYSIKANINFLQQSESSSPVAIQNPITTCVKGEICQFVIAARDPDENDSLTYTLATAAEAGKGFKQPGEADPSILATIDSVSGIFTWDATNATLATGDNKNTLYSTQVLITDVSNNTIPLDFFIKLVEPDNGEPRNLVIEAGDTTLPACGESVHLQLGQEIEFSIFGSDADIGQIVELRMEGPEKDLLKDKFLPKLPVTGNPVSTKFSWVPDRGTTIFMSFIVQSYIPSTELNVPDISIGSAAQCDVEFIVNAPTEPCDADGDGIVDRNDITAIINVRNTSTESGDINENLDQYSIDDEGPGKDGRITLQDAFWCSGKCTNKPYCN